MSDVVRLTPWIGKVDNENPHKYYSNPSRSLVLGKGMLVWSNNTSHNKVANSHTNATRNEDLLATNIVDPENGWNSEDELEDTSYSSGQQWSSGTAELQILKDLWAMND